MIPMKFMKSKAGFTLVELIVVIAILGILAGIAVPAYSGYIKKANSAKDTQFLSAVYTAAASACAAKGEVTEIHVTATSGDVSAITAKYMSGTTEKEINLYDKTTTANNDSDFVMYIGTGVSSTAAELVTDGSYKDGAEWHDASAPTGKVSGWNAKAAANG